MRVLITGSEGQLGNALLRNIPNELKKDNLEILKANKKELDLSKENKCNQYLDKYKPSWIINCAAYTSVDKAEIEPAMAFLVNSKGPQHLAKKCNEIGCKMIHLSTDFVFDGKTKKPYSTDDATNPINVYGKSKALGEKLILEQISIPTNFFIIRTSWVLSNYGNNFLLKIIELLSKRESLHVVNDQIGCITNVNNLAKICWRLLIQADSGFKFPSILHYCERGSSSWFDVAQKINEYILNKKLFQHKSVIIPVNSDFFNLPAKRPNFSLLDCEKTYKLFNFDPPNWDESITNLLDSTRMESFLNSNN